MQSYLTVLRFLHIVPGICWAGGIFYMAFFVMPAIRKLGPDGGKFMQQLARTNRMPDVMISLALTSILAGSLLFWEVSGHLDTVWLKSVHGLMLLFGALAGITAFMLGLLINRPAAKRMAEIGAELAKAGGPPNPAQVQELGNLRTRIFMGTNLIAWFVVLAIVLMSVIRYM